MLLLRLLLAASLTVSLFCIPASSQEVSQTSPPSYAGRYLLQAVPMGGDKLPMLFRIDTVTGKVWKFDFNKTSLASQELIDNCIASDKWKSPEAKNMLIQSFKEAKEMKYPILEDPYWELLPDKPGSITIKYR